MSFKIEPRKIIETGLDHVDFDPSKVKLVFDNKFEEPSWGNEAERRVFYTYEDEEVCKKINDLYYSFGWGTTKVRKPYDRTLCRIDIIKLARTKLRKKKGGNGWTDNSLITHMNNCKKLDKFDLDWAIGEFKTAIEEFNTWYEEEQRKEVKRVFGSVTGYKFDEPEVTNLIDQYEDLKKQIKEVSKKITETKYNCLLNDLRHDKLGVASDFKQDLIEEVTKNKNSNVDDFGRMFFA